MKKILLPVIAILFLISCSNKYMEQYGKVQDSNFFGEKINTKGTISYGELLKNMETNPSVQAKVVATVESVCQKKGCWVNLVSDNPNDPPMFVKFKDYGFFMPKDCSGQHAIFEGVATKSITPVDELRHYAQDAGKSEEEINKITEPKEELTFLASGVILFDK